MDCVIHGVAKSQTQLSDFHFHFISHIHYQDYGTEGISVILQKSKKVETDDPVSFVRARLKGRIDELTVNEHRGGVTIYAVSDGLRHEFSFNL